MIKLIALLVLLIILIGISFSIIALMISPLITGWRRAPYVPSFDYHLKLMKQHIILNRQKNKGNEVFLDDGVIPTTGEAVSTTTTRRGKGSQISKAVRYKLRKGAKLADLGCGDGKALRFFAKEFGILGEGYEINSFVSRYGKLLNRLKGRKKIKIIRANFKKADLGKYDYIYMYLFPNQLIYIEDRVFEHISQDAIIISNSFKFVKHKPFDVIHDKKGKEVIRLYRR